MTRARNIAGFSTITTTPSPVHVGPIGVLTATRIDGEFNQVDLATRNITAAGIAATNLQVSGITTGLNVSGIITAQNGINFNGTSTGLNVSGVGTIATLDVNGNGDISGNLTVGGVLTYEDVTRVDSVGVITAREQVHVGTGVSIAAGGLNVTAGITTVQALQATSGTFSSNVFVTDQIVHTGDTDTQIRFPSADTFTVETAGAERFRVDSSGNVSVRTNEVAFSGIGTLRINSGSTFGELNLDGGSTNHGGEINLTGGSSGGQIQFRTGVGVGQQGEKMRLDSNGRLLIGTTTEGEASADDLTIGGSGNQGITIRSGTTNYGLIYFSDATSGTAEYAGAIEYKHDDNFMVFRTSTGERVKITSNGRVLIGAGAVGAASNPVAQGGLQVSTNGASGAPTLMLGADGTGANTQTITDNTAKDCRIGYPNYDIDEEPLALISGFVGDGSAIDGSSGARIYLGGGTSYLNAVNQIRFYTTSGNQNTTSGTERMRISPGGVARFGSGANDVPVITGPGGLDVSQYALSICMGASSGSSGQARANNTTKEARLVIPHYTNSEEPVVVAYAYSQSGSNILNIGGGTGLGNNVTEISFNTASDTTTTGASTRWQIASDGDLIGTNPAVIHSGSSSGSVTLYGGATNHGGKIAMYGGNTSSDIRFYSQGSTSSPAERLRIDSNQVRHGSSSVLAGSLDDVRIRNSSDYKGLVLRGTGGSGGMSNYDEYVFLFNRMGSDGSIITFNAQGSQEGSISVSGSTVSYNGGHLSRWSQLVGISTNVKDDRPTIYQGTVMSNLDEMCEWTGEDNQQLNKTKVSDTVGDKNVAGVFWTWDDDDDVYTNDFYVAMVGDMVIRVAASTTVARGDLLESAGDGTAKPQSDDIVRSKTIAKITSTTSTATYPDGTKAYPCVLMGS